MRKFILLMFLGLADMTLANEARLQLSGFGTLGVVHVESDHFGYRSDISQDDGVFEGELDIRTTSILGVQAEYRLDEKVDLVTQFVYRDQNKLSMDRVLNMAFLRFDPSPEWQIRVGRTPIDTFHLSEYRDVGFAMPWAKAPNEVYGMIAYRHLDGVDASYIHQLSKATLRTKLFTGRTESDQSTYKFSNSVKLDNIWGISFELDAMEWILTANYSVANLDGDSEETKQIADTIAQLDPALWTNNLEFAEAMRLDNKDARYASIGCRYFLSNWTFLAELTHVDGEGNYIRKSQSRYASIIYNHGAHSFYSSFGKSDTEKFIFNEEVNPFIPLELIAAATLAPNYLNANQTSFSLGWRWDVTDTAALKVQWERADIDQAGASLWLYKDFEESPAEVVHSYYLNLSFVF